MQAFSLKRFLADKPETLKSYVNCGLKLAHLTVGPLNALLKHLIEVQGLDPNRQPILDLSRQLRGCFTANHTSSYSSDFDFDNIFPDKMHEEADDYIQMHGMPFVPEVNITSSPRGADSDKNPVEDLADLIRSIPNEELKAAFHTINEVNEERDQETENPEELFARGATLKILKKVIDSHQRDAEEIQRLVATHKLNPSDLQALVNEGLDPQSALLWEEKYGSLGKNEKNGRKL